MPEVDVNYAAVVVAALVSMVVGSVWYSSGLFGNEWAKAVGIKLKDMGGSNVTRSYILVGLGALVQAYILAHFVSFAQADTWKEGVVTGLWLWLGFVAVTLLANYMFAGRSWNLWKIDAGYFLVVLAINGAILATWVN